MPAYDKLAFFFGLMAGYGSWHTFGHLLNRLNKIN